MTRRREAYYVEYGGDFGLTGLAARLCADPGPRPGARAEPALVARTALDDGDVQLGQDVRLLLASGLPEEVLRTVWLAAVGGRFDPAAHGTDVPTWLHTVAELCPPYDPLERTETEQAVPEEELAAAVLAEIRSATPGLTGAGAGRDVVRSLERVVSEADADLSLRLLLRALKACAVPVEEVRYRRLLALGDRLAYPHTAVFEGLAVRWPPLDPGRRDFEFGFGLPGLCAMFDGEWEAWKHEGTGTPREHVERLTRADAGMPPGVQAAVLWEDVTRLLVSGLSDEEVTALWRTAARRQRAADAFDTDGRAWLREIAEVCTERLAEVDPAYTPYMSPPRTDLTARVGREVQEVIAPLSAATDGDGTAAPLQEIVTSVDPDLGFRLLLRVVEAYGIPVPRSRYARYRELGERFGYRASQVVEAVEALVTDG
ncbi:hypothetical protein ACIQAC_25635 [Streptomyces sp. NPDC088387]|uniref:hypothetical protein n=1 Tax=Streptomyces sp. NPDC088387 TaxID=3365859 RepID=UPI00380602F1